MSDVVENIGEQQNSAPSNEVAAQVTESPAEELVNKNVDETVVSPPSKGTIASAMDQSSVPDDKNAVEEIKAKPAAVAKDTSPVVGDNKKTPAKRTPSKRLSFIERAQKESEELVKNMGGSLEMEGGRRTRSSARGTPTRVAAASTPPPAKKARNSPASGATTPTRSRARGRKLDTSVDGEEEPKPTPSKKQRTPAKGRGKAAMAAAAAAAAKEAAEDETPPEAEKKLDDKSEEKQQQLDKSDENAAKENEGKNKVEITQAASDKPEKDPAVSETETATTTDSAEKSHDVSNELATEATNEKSLATVKDDDKVDAVLDPVVEETQSQVAASELSAQDSSAKESEDVVIVQSESETNDMDSDDVELVENATEKDLKSQVNTLAVEKKEEEEEEEVSVKAEETVVIGSKDTTPEPMEVDSSSNSNDIIEKMDDDVTIVETKPQEIAADPNSTQLDNAKTSASTNDTAKAVADSDMAAVEDVIEKKTIEPTTNDAVTARSPSGVDADCVESPNNSLEAKTSSDEAANVAITNNDNEVENKATQPAANDTNKSENDLCEPKIATSPPISAASEKSAVTTTPQTCN